MRVEIIYGDDHVDVVIDEVVDMLVDKVITDKQIAEVIGEHIDETISSGPWPSYQLGHGDRESLMDAVKEALVTRSKEED